MAIIDRIKFDGLRDRQWLVYKYYKEDLVLGTQLIVAEGQVAVFVKGGNICDTFPAGTYTLSTQNLPIIQSVLNIPFGGKTPFSAEIFYINIVSKLDINWGTTDPIPVIDPKYFVRLNIRAFGQMGLKITDYTVFLRELIGAVGLGEVIKYDVVRTYFKGLLIQKMKTIIADIIINKKISAFEITPKLDEISELSKERISPEFKKFGLLIVNFYIDSVNFPEEDFDAINDILKNKAEFEIIGDNRYATKRSFDVYEGAANNESGPAGALLAGGLGIGLGAQALKNGPSALNNTPSQSGNTSFCPECHAVNISSSKFCCQCGHTLGQESKKCPKCNAEISSGSKFCPECGYSLIEKICPDCGTHIEAGNKFCPQCGKKVE